MAVVCVWRGGERGYWQDGVWGVWGVSIGWSRWAGEEGGARVVGLGQESRRWGGQEKERAGGGKGEGGSGGSTYMWWALVLQRNQSRHSG